jgi:hypothetical protein
MQRPRGAKTGACNALTAQKRVQAARSRRKNGCKKRAIIAETGATEALVRQVQHEAKETMKGYRNHD